MNGRLERSVQELFRTAMARSDPAVMREGLERLLGVADGQGLDAEEEYLLRTPEFVMEMPQSGERIPGRDAMRSMQQAFPAPPQSIKIRRVVGAQRFWVLEGELDYGQGPWSAALVIELDEDGLITRETRYYAEKSEPPEWRSSWVEALD
ncbi:MAG TPA: nuclear transport factor 2 family protein [Nocardioides sp.]|uniref:nuclear transport factor 2 family protein n=1 Tax=Nocardioides sp. TaxID=35761 RepID=UPI002F41AEBF